MFEFVKTIYFKTKLKIKTEQNTTVESPFLAIGDQFIINKSLDLIKSICSVKENACWEKIE